MRPTRELRERAALGPDRGLGDRAGTRAPSTDVRVAARRILHLLAPAPFGGLETVVQALASAQAARGDDAHVGVVVNSESPRHPILGPLEEAGVSVHEIRVPDHRYIREALAVAALCRAVAPDVVHTHGYRSDVLHGGAARLCSIPTVSTAHGFIGGGLKGRVYEALQRRSYRKRAAVVAVSRPMVEELRKSGVPIERVHCLPNAWAQSAEFLSRAEARRQLGLDQERFSVGFIGRLGLEKGPDVLLAAIGRLSPPPDVVFVGAGGLRPTLEVQARELGVETIVRWVGAVDGAARLLPAFDLVVLSSRTEGTPMVLLEAMAARVPVVATSVGGIPDVISDAEGLLVPPANADALAEAIATVRAEVEEAKARAERAYERVVGAFDVRIWVERHDDVYASVSGDGAARSNE